MIIESIVWCIQKCATYVMSEDAQVELNNITYHIAELEAQRDNLSHLLKQGAELVNEYAAENARLTAANESMQEDAVQNTYAFNLMLTANKAQAAEIAELKGIAANLAKHLEAINNICEREDVDYQAWKKIRAHCEAANVMEAL